MTKKYKCNICQDSGWVCEEHQDKPFEHIHKCGAGMLCKCNVYNPPWNYPDVTRIEVQDGKEK